MSLPPNQPGRSGRQRHDGAAAMGTPPKKKARGGLAARVDGLASDMEQIRSLLLALQPGTGQGLAGLQPGPPSSQFESDALSLAASANLFNEAMTEGDASHTLDEASCSSAQGSLQGAADTSMAAVLRTALARLQLDAAQTDGAFSHLITPVAYEGLSGLRNSQRMAFGPPNAYLPGSPVPHNPTDAPPEPQEAGGHLGPHVLFLNKPVLWERSTVSPVAHHLNQCSRKGAQSHQWLTTSTSALGEDPILTSGSPPQPVL
ncbi:unnamed protein product [Gadus morhua 'NCC']